MRHHLPPYALAGVFALALLQLPAASAQVVMKTGDAVITLEAWANGVFAVGADGARADDADWQTDGAARALAVWQLPGRGRIGVRAVAAAEGGVSDDSNFDEHSLLWSGALGRIEYGERQGLPDVLSGYAPNPFTFTTAEFGPASGLSLDPGGGIVQRFVADDSARALDQLSTLGYGTSPFADRSRKLIYVSPKRAGWLGGLSYAADADGDETSGLIQAGLVHERYYDQNVLRIGGAWAHADAAEKDLDSWLAGVSLDLEQTWLLGVAATLNPDESDSPVSGWPMDAFGVTASVNYNHGPWTAGGFLQDARGRESAGAARERLRAAETGISYRTSTRIRFFLSLYRYRLDGTSERPAANDNLLIAGLRATL